MEFKMDEEAINQYVSQAILKSALGQRFEANVSKITKEIISGYSSPLRDIILDCLKIEFQKQMQKPENQEIIKESVSRMLSQKIFSAISDKVITHLIEEIREYYKE